MFVENDEIGAKLNIHIPRVDCVMNLITIYFRRAYIILSLFSSYIVSLIIMIVNNHVGYFVKFISAFIPFPLMY